MSVGLAGLRIPASWRWWPLKRAALSISRGSAPDYVEDGPVWAVSQAANQPGGLDWSRARFHAFGGNPANLKGLLRPGDVLINSTGRGTLGRVGYFTGSPDRRVEMADGHVTRVRVRPDVLHPRFAYYYLSSDPFQHYIYSALIVGATNQIELVGERLASAPIPMPPIEEQRRIADLLDAKVAVLDRLSALSLQQLSLMDERLVELCRAMTTGTLRSIDHVETGVPWMPKVASGWALNRVGRVFRTGSGTTPKSSEATYFEGDVPWVNTGDLRDGPVTAVNRRVSRLALREYPTLALYRPGSLIVAMYGATIGRVGMLETEACVNQACCVLSQATLVDTRFAFYWFLSHRSEIIRLASGGGQPNISQDIVRGLRIPAPDLHEQREIVQKIDREWDRAAAMRSALSRRINHLTERRQALITAAVTGQVEVTTAGGMDV